jgi:hypothetical protein
MVAAAVSWAEKIMRRIDKLYEEIAVEVLMRNLEK